MRKLLLASAALVGASSAMGGFASAQPASTPAPVVTTPQMQTLVTGNSGNSANSNNNYQAAMLPGSVANPTPGTIGSLSVWITGRGMFARRRSSPGIPWSL